MHDSSSGPCDEMSRMNASPLPAPNASPPIVPSSRPLNTSANTVPTPNSSPPTNAASVTWMLLTSTWVANTLPSPAPKSRPSAGGSAASAKSAGTRPTAAPGSTSPHTAPATAGTSRSAHASAIIRGRSASRRQ